MSGFGIELIYAFAILAIVQGLITLLDGFRAARHMRGFRPELRSRDRVVVFCPCKGLDPEFEKNARSLLEQDYPNFAVKFVVESEDDIAYSVLRQMGVNDVLIAGKALDCGQKVHNLFYAVDHAGDDAAIYAFCDSDARYPNHWLSHLVAAVDAGRGVATGYRWYTAVKADLPTLLRSAWNASAVGMLSDHKRNFAWGGSMAMRRETFDRIGVREAWKGALSDDYAVTRASARNGLPIIFTPACLVPSHGACTWPELLEFTTRQILITRIYHPLLWRVAFGSQLIFNIAFWGLILTGGAAPAALAFTIFLLAAVKAWVRLSAVSSVLSDPSLLKFRWFYILCPPIVALLFLYNMIRSAFGDEIVWRQIRYKLVSPNETRVLGASSANES